MRKDKTRECTQVENDGINNFIAEVYATILARSNNSFNPEYVMEVKKISDNVYVKFAKQRVHALEMIKAHIPVWYEFAEKFKLDTEPTNKIMNEVAKKYRVPFTFEVKF